MDVKVSHIFREGNACNDRLVSFGWTTDGIIPRISFWILCVDCAQVQGLHANLVVDFSFERDFCAQATSLPRLKSIVSVGFSPEREILTQAIVTGGATRPSETLPMSWI
ncbi:hypothetical protein Lal_00006784, partial [Lupinus albus]